VPGEKDYRHCHDDIIKNCSAPCIGKISEADYRARVLEACKFLEGRSKDVPEELEQEMQAAAAKHDFEKAAALRDLITRTEGCGARRVAGDSPQAGYFIAPTLLADVPDDAPAMQEEPFGPLACATAFDSLDEAITRANANPYGLAGYLFTDSARAIHTVSSRLEVGSLAVNGIGVSVPEAPFGGVKDSGLGHKEGVIEAMKGFTTVKTYSLPWPA
jgi:acyl-CoA reductase-like NAD-dependent aldehyde dehydrogenase